MYSIYCFFCVVEIHHHGPFKTNNMTSNMKGCVEMSISGAGKMGSGTLNRQLGSREELDLTVNCPSVNAKTLKLYNQRREGEGGERRRGR